MDEILLEHQQRYPDMEVRDVVKLLYQREFGGGHLIADEQQSLQRIQKEYQELLKEAEPIAEAIGGGLYRLPLQIIKNGLAPETLNHMFIETAKTVTGNTEHFKDELDKWLSCLKANESEVHFRNAETYLHQYQKQGYPMVSHSSTYHNRYHPAYRIISEKYVQCLKICCEIDQHLKSHPPTPSEPLLIAIDGCSASGKTTIAQTLSELYDCNLFHMDDFFLRPEQRTPERFREPGGNVDYERFYETVLRPLLSGSQFSYRPFNCTSQTLTNEIKITPKPLNIIEGAYSQHHYFGNIYHLTYWFFISPEEQKRRILKRNGAEMLNRFVNEWIPLENAYFEAKGVTPKTPPPAGKSTQ